MDALFFPVILLLLLLVAIVKSPRFKGFIGEAYVSKGLKKLAEEGDMHLFDDVTLPVKDGTTQIDHVLISRSGVFVIETKNMSGWIFGAERQSQWTQVLYKKKTKFQNPLRQNYKHIKAIEECLGVDGSKVQGAIVFVGGAVPKTDFPSSVYWRRNSMLDFLKAPHQVILTESEVEALCQALESQRFERGLRTTQQHIKNVRSAQVEAQASTDACPRCGSAMVERRSKKTNDVFLGCTNFPKCRGTRKVEASKVVAFSRQQ
ncbi:NERD domain-containing protein [Thioclava sp. JE_KL1]|uniref:NERD domain-containing protein n=1 Tax=Thioclava sp. JE_KL1 TaxID=2651187 RepID=UPI00128C0261|nr:NERD domain-containing protein [Thioclava sp. JE_KL1]MPQ95378.1 nuclease [Thioclava sp. JE_KL1]